MNNDPCGVGLQSLPRILYAVCINEGGMTVIFEIKHPPYVIHLGKQTENGVNEISFDCGEWVREFPGVEINVMPTRPGENKSYPAAISRSGNVVTWNVSSADTALHGYGTVELLGLVDGKRKISATIQTSVQQSNLANEGDAPEVEKPWIDEVLNAAHQASESADKAEAAAENAKRSALEYGLKARGETAKASGNPIAFLPDAGSLLKPVTVLTPKQEGEGNPSPENVRPISGWDSLELRHAGKNVLPWPYASGEKRVHNGIAFTVNEDGSVTANGTGEVDKAIFVLGTGLKISNESITSGAGSSATDGVFVLSDMARYNPNNDTASMNLNSVGKTYENVTYYPQAEVGTVPTEYTPTAGLEVYTATLGETVYGGRYDWLTGKLVIEWYGEEVQNLTDQYYNEAGGFVAGKLQRVVYGEYNAVKPESIVCSHYVSGSQAKVVVGGGTNSMLRIYGSGFTNLDDWRTYMAEQKAAGTPVQVVYRLATPIEIQLTPTIITAVEPEQNNTLYGDGSIEVEYIKPLLESIREHGGGGNGNPDAPVNITINGEGPDENGNFIINTLNDVEIAQLRALIT
jgi:hypothetical protein